MACATLKRPLESDNLYSPNSRPSKRRRFSRAIFGTPSTSIPSSRDELPSPFSGVTSRLSPEQMQVRLRQEIRHLRRLKQLQIGLEKEGSSNSNGGSPCGSGPSSPNSNHLGIENFGELMKSGVGMTKDNPLFTFRQVGLICERMLQEREETLRREYEQVLSSKLSEQYDTFVKFTHDQIQKRFEAASAPSYLS